MTALYQKKRSELLVRKDKCQKIHNLLSKCAKVVSNDWKLDETEAVSHSILPPYAMN